jgi:hypothetical protein
LASTLLESVGARATLLLAGAGPVLAACTLLAVTGSSRPSSPHVEALG